MRAHSHTHWHTYILVFTYKLAQTYTCRRGSQCAIHANRSACVPHGSLSSACLLAQHRIRCFGRSERRRLNATNVFTALNVHETRHAPISTPGVLHSKAPQLTKKARGRGKHIRETVRGDHSTDFGNCDAWHCCKRGTQGNVSPLG